MSTMLYTLLTVLVAVNSFEGGIPDDSHAVFADKNGVFVLHDKEMILDQIKNGLNPRKIAPNSDIHNLLQRRSLLTTSANEQLLDIHNEFRSATAFGNTPSQPAGNNINELIWDPYLAKVAQDYSALCEWEHNPNRKTDLAQYQGDTQYLFDDNTLSVGENIYYTTSNESMANVLYGIQLYYDEYAYYTFNNNTDGCCKGGEQCGHYTQVVWYNTRYVGCGYTVCDGLGGAVGSGTPTLYKVCNYFPAGNFGGESPYLAGCSCSNCPSDRTCNDQGLCGGCGSLYYDYCGDYYGNCAEDLADSCPSNGCSFPPSANNNTYCDTCRSTCGTCSESILASRDACNDATGSDLAGNFNGRDVDTPNVASEWTGSPYCDGDNSITQCSGCLRKDIMSALVFIFAIVVYYVLN